ncbi:MAG: nucleotidyltransferase [Cyclobacteriaceae bacterium]|nr:nucleotidyltransferase [Cyclobacteriaceae bacterium]
MDVVRWKTRYQNYHKALLKLERAVTQTSLTELEQEGLIQRFEFTFELAWKTLQDLLVFSGYADILGPRPVLEQSLHDGYIENSMGWARMLKSRNETTHTYDESTARRIVTEIQSDYFPLLKKLDEKLKSLL